MFSVKEYILLSNTPVDDQTRWAAFFLDGTAKTWYINTYDGKPTPSLTDFLDAFKKFHLKSNYKDDAAIRIERGEQGSRTIAEYSTEFKLLTAELGETAHPDWLKRHYLRGLNRVIRKDIASDVRKIEDLDEIIEIAQESHDALAAAGVRFDKPDKPSYFTPTPRESKSSTPLHNIGTSGTSTINFTSKLTDDDREFLRNNSGCTYCRRINVDHGWWDCPYKRKNNLNSRVDNTTDRNERKKTNKIKQESVNQVVDSPTSESESDSEYYSVPSIKIHAMLQDTPIEGVADSGATVNLLSSKLVQQQRLPTRPARPIRLHQPMARKGVIVNEKLISKITIPSKSWTSKKPAIFTVAPLKDIDAIFGMPFLAQENILVDAAKGNIIIPNGEDEEEDFSLEDQLCKQVVWPSICPKAKHSRTHDLYCNAITNSLSTTTLANSPISQSEADRLNKKYRDMYPDVFADTLPNKPPPPGAPKHRIILKDEKCSINGRMFRVPTQYWQKMMLFIEHHLRAGRIRPSSSNIAAGTWMIPKDDPDDMPRVVHDYRKLNANTVKDHTPLPRQDEIIEVMARATVRGTIDLPNAYYQTSVAEEDRHKTAFKTPFGMYEWCVMPQGLCNAPATFQRYMNWVLRDYIGKICAVYIDDIAIWSSSVEEHERNVKSVLDALREAGIIASQKKSRLFADSVLFLGHIISSKGVEVAQDKVDKILAARTPRSPKDIKVFNGLVNYIAQFIPGLSEWSSVLSNLTKKNVQFRWETAQQIAFRNIKRLTRNAPICLPIDHTKSDPIMLVADASNRGIGGYYGQGKDYKTMRPAGFHSRTFNPAEKNYPTHDKEMLAIIDCLKKWEPQLTGTRFEILTDHAPLTHWKTQKDLSARQIRWQEVLSRFDTDIRHIPGISNSAADALSRYPFVQSSNDIQDLQVCAVSTVEFDCNILKSVRSAYKDDKLFGPVIQNPDRYGSIWQIEDGLIFFEGRLCVPSNDRKSREILLKLHHDNQVHFGVEKTCRSIAMDYYWPGLSRDVDNYIKSCTTCAVNKSSTQAPAGLLHSMPIPPDRFTELAMDFVMPLPKSRGYDGILVMTDRLVNYVKIEPIHTTATAPDIAKIVYESWYRQFGLPSAITSDRDKLFTSNFWKELHKKIKVDLRMSTSYHPETDGSSERSNKTAIQSLRHLVNTRQTDWADHLINVEVHMNNSVNATTGKTPTELLYGVPLRLFPSPRSQPLSDVPAVTDYLERIQDSIAIARDRHAEAKTKQTTYANKRRRKEPEYKVGDAVYLNSEHLRLAIKQKGRSAKFFPRFIGPFNIVKARPETSTYKLDLPRQYKFHPIFHANRLKPVIFNDPELFPAREQEYQRPPPIDPDDNIYIVDSIKDHRRVGRGRKFLIHWQGYPDSEDSWEKEKDISKELVRDYLRGLETD
jgi:hypothetical protein